jgi:2-polyprenyl-3-methyl-5-hydroxy-6-metoxy-1,4-benzoquinol methylase
MRRCPTCGVAYRSDRAEAFAEELYDYYRERCTWPHERVYSPLNRTRILELLAGLRPGLRDTRLLDVGCGVGSVVEAAQVVGWTARGIDLSPAAIMVARHFGLPCENVDLLAPELDDARFDLITASEVIEHVLDPVGFLERCRDLLDRGGLLYLTTPNFDSLSRRSLGERWRAINPEHLVLFTRSSLIRTADRAGLRVQRIESRNVELGTLRQLLRRERSRPSSAVITRDREANQALRQRVEGSAGLRALKGSANRVLDVSRSGDTLVATFAAR